MYNNKGEYFTSYDSFIHYHLLPSSQWLSCKNVIKEETERRKEESERVSYKENY